MIPDREELVDKILKTLLFFALTILLSFVAYLSYLMYSGAKNSPAYETCKKVCYPYRSNLFDVDAEPMQNKCLCDMRSMYKDIP